MFNGSTGEVTGISRSKNKNYLHNSIQIDNQNGINFTNNFSSMNNKKINFNEFTCYAPIPWEEYTGNCNGENIKKDHPDAEKLLSKLSNITSSIEKIKDDLQFSINHNFFILFAKTI